ncbi:acyl-CoA dehydrogenase family protein [Rhodobium gokarnense]|uniref:Acyl-CoA dehydrogenase n=1 Tax=Rhodobium gokarnense TaxID=364296 RepID=A0ABT3HA56_9HYPH|nr:acyl-CoA dehydrogenase family protein [Rhodobium gokarnense]MCW2307282.1 putative acyl-CoA dehydrogenase [Rhodobium gokarnense]
MNERNDATHEVTNQAPPFAGRNIYESDSLLIGVLESVIDPPIEAELVKLGAFYGSREANEFARLANTQGPKLRTHDAWGNRLDTVEFHPSYHAFMRRAFEAGLAGSLWQEGGAETGRRYQLRAARMFLAAQAESGHLAPIVTTSAAIGAVGRVPDLGAWRAKLVSRRYDHRFLPVDKKLGASIGMGVAEKQGGTDLTATTTRAAKADDGTYRLTGHKWFVAGPMSDGFIVLAQAEGGLTAFLVPRLLPDGSVNAIRFQRLKDKLGNRSNATGEAEFAHAVAYLLGAPGNGFETIAGMADHIRLDCCVGSAALMRSAAAQAVHNARHRFVFGSELIEQPLMARSLADMTLDVAAATALAFRLARAYDNRDSDPAEAAYARIMTPAAKYWITKAAPPLIAEALECFGGNGYVEDFDLARIYREAPFNALWEGGGNVMCLEVLRVLEADGEALDAVLSDIKGALGDTSLVSIDVLRAAARACINDVGSARILTEQLALTAAAAAVRRYAPRLIADAFLHSRLGSQWRATYGMLDARFDAQAIVDYAFPDV